MLGCLFFGAQQPDPKILRHCGEVRPTLKVWHIPKEKSHDITAGSVAIKANIM